MSIQEFAPKDKTVTIEQIVLGHIQELTKLSLKEFRGGYTDKKVSGNLVEQVYFPDVRKQMIQGIEFLEILLAPRFKKEYAKDEFQKIIKEFEKNLENYNAEKKERDSFILEKLNISLRLFRRLMFLLHDSGYLKRKMVVG